MGIFESHAHYVAEQFDNDREDIMNKLETNGIEYVIEVGDSIENSKKAIELAQKHDFMYAAVGIHPENIDDISDNDYEELEKLLIDKESNKIVAIGEIGIDYHYTKDNKEKQKEAFKKQIDIARRHDLPIIVHSRDAMEDTLEMIKEESKNGLKGVIHCFPGTIEIAKEYQKLGLYIGIGGVVTFSNAKRLVEVVKEMPIDMMLIETDSPYLSPDPHRGERNDSSNLKYVISKIAELKKISEEEILKVTNENARKLFNI